MTTGAMILAISIVGLMAPMASPRAETVSASRVTARRVTYAHRWH